MKTFHADTMTALHDKMCQTLVTASASKLDVISTVDVQIHNVMAEAEHMEWEFDLKDMWLTKSRWSMMINQYLDGEEVQAWINQCTGKIGTRGRGIAVLRTKTVAPRGGAATGHTNKETRRWGSCMLAISYKAKPHPQITLYSRTSYLGYIGALDLTVAWVMGRYLAHAMGIKVGDIRFVWLNEAIQWHNFKSLAYLLNHPDKDKRKQYRRLLTKKFSKLRDDEVATIKSSPGLELSRKWLAKVIKEDKEGVTYGDMTYNTYRRIRRRWHTEVHGLEFAEQFEGWSRHKRGPKEGKKKEFFKAYKPLPSTPADSLDLTRIGLPWGQPYGTEYDLAADEQEMEDEDY